MSEILAAHLTPSQIIMDIMVLFMLAGAVDYVCGNKLGLGHQFAEGFGAFGSIAITMTGVLVLVPLISNHLGPVISPLFRAVGVDPAMFAGAILACDMGGWPLAQELAASPEAAGLGGMILSAMMGVNIVFNIPVALGIIDKEDRPAMSRGILCGFITVPIGCFAGGLTAGYSLPVILVNLAPVIVISVLISLMLKFFPDGTTRVFLIFGRIIAVIAALAAAVSIASHLTGITVIPGLGSVLDAMDVLVSIILVLPGAYVMVTVVSRLLEKPFARIGKLLGINDKSTLGLVTTLANAVPTFSLIKDMDERGKIVNFAFLTGAGFLLGDHLAFCSAMEPALVLPMLAGKLTAGVTAVILALWMTRQKKA